MTTAENQRGRGGGVTIASSGSLEDTPLADVIRRTVLDERSGELRVAAPPAVKTISFDRGFIVYAGSNLESDGLGKLLIDSGRISKRELALVGMLTRAPRRAFLFGERNFRDGSREDSRASKSSFRRRRRLGRSWLLP